MRRRRLPTTIMLTGVLALAVSACGSSAAKTAAKKDTGVVTTTTVPLHPGNDPAIRHLATVSGCAAAPGGWEASGTVQNPNKKTTTYKITIYFANAEGTIEATGSTSTSVDASKTGTWKTSATFASPDPKTTCVLSGVA